MRELQSRYCFICNKPMGQMWVCDRCCDQYPRVYEGLFTRWEHIPVRKSPSSAFAPWEDYLAFGIPVPSAVKEWEWYRLPEGI